MNRGEAREAARPGAGVAGLSASKVWPVLALALALRLLWAAFVPVVPVSDGFLYDAFATSIATGRGYAFPDGGLTVYWPVGAPAAYALVYKVFGRSGAAVAVTQAILGTVIVWLAFRLARRTLGERAAAITGWLLAVWPLMIQFTTIMASEMFFIALLLAALEVWTLPRIRVVWRAVAWGLLIAAASYVRPTAWPLLVIFPAIAWCLDRNWRALAPLVLISVCTAAVAFAPWVYRNEQLFDRFVLIAANAGANLWMGNNPGSNGGYMPLPDIKFANEVDRDRYFSKAATDYIKSHPIAYLRLSVLRTATTYSRETIGVVWNEEGLSGDTARRFVTPLKLVSTAYWWLMMVLGACGVWRLTRAKRLLTVWPLLAALGFLALVPVLTVAQDRYHVPIDPFLAVFAAWGLLGLIERRRAPIEGASPHPRR